MNVESQRIVSEKAPAYADIMRSFTQYLLLAKQDNVAHFALHRPVLHTCLTLESGRVVGTFYTPTAVVHSS